MFIVGVCCNGNFSVWLYNVFEDFDVVIKGFGDGGVLENRVV